MFLAVASTWEERKGLTDYIALSQKIGEDCTIVLIGLSEKQIELVSPYSNILGLPRTHNVQELIFYYSIANAILNLSKEETFGLTTVEGLACGTPSIVYNSTASPELVDKYTGMIVNTGDLEGVRNAMIEVLGKGRMHYTESCVKRAKRLFSAKERFNDYVELYLQLLKV